MIILIITSKITPNKGDKPMKCKCKRCGHEWIARIEKPKACPACKQYSWNKEGVK